MAEFTEFGKRERNGWSDGHIVDAYLKHFVPITDAVGKHLADRTISEGDSVLDLCCGQGTLTAALCETADFVAGLDFSPDMISRAINTAPRAEIVEGDAMDLPFADGRFDRVICNFGMMHIPDQPRALAEIRRVLKPSGTFAMATWVGPPGSPAFTAVFGALKAHADFSAAPPQPDLFAFADPELTAMAMASSGLEMEAHETVLAEWRLDEPEELFDIFLTATVGASMLIRSQSEETVREISRAVAGYVAENCRDGMAFTVPVPVAVIAARAV